MTDIRPFERADLNVVSALLERHLPRWGHDQGFLARTLVDSPWADPDLPSLVAVDDQGDILGFIGAQVRRLQLDDRELRGVCCGHLTVAPRSWRRARGRAPVAAPAVGQPGPDLDG